MGMKDVTELHPKVSRYRNKKYDKYKHAIVHHLSNERVNDIINKKLNFVVNTLYPGYENYSREYFSHFDALIIDDNEEFRMLVEYTKEEIKKYKDVKDAYPVKDLKDDDKVLVVYLEVKEVFENE